MTGAVVLRPAQTADAPGIARVHYEAWQAGYRGVLPDAVLADFSYPRRLALWQGLLCGPSAPPPVEVAADGPDIAGFVWLRRIAEPGSAYGGEIVSLNVLPARQGRGLGRRLMAAGAARLARLGAANCYLWTYRDNLAARRFYEALGGRVVDRDVERHRDLALPTVAYGWPSLDGLTAAEAGRTGRT